MQRQPWVQLQSRRSSPQQCCCPWRLPNQVFQRMTCSGDALHQPQQPQQACPQCALVSALPMIRLCADAHQTGLHAFVKVRFPHPPQRTWAGSTRQLRNTQQSGSTVHRQNPRPNQSPGRRRRRQSHRVARQKTGSVQRRSRCAIVLCMTTDSLLDARPIRTNMVCNSQAWPC